MSINVVKGTRICGIAGAVSTNWIPTDHYTDILGENAIASFKKSSGVEGRYLALPHQTASDFCFAAAQRLIEEKQIDRSEIGVLVLVTLSPDYGESATACVLQDRLGLPKECTAFDVTLGCSGYTYGLNILSNLLSTSNKKYGLLLAGDTKGAQPSPNENSESNSVILLLGDCGTATLMEKQEKQCEDMVFLSETDGSGFRTIGDIWRGYRHKVTKTALRMDDIEVFNFILASAPKMAREYMEYMGMTVEDYDCFALHQASYFALKQLARKLKIPAEKMPISLNKFGNTGPASIPITLVNAYGNMQENRQLRTYMSGFGVGLSIATTSAVLNTADILPLIETDEWFDDGLF